MAQEIVRLRPERWEVLWRDLGGKIPPDPEQLIRVDEPRQIGEIIFLPAMYGLRA